MSRQFCKPLTPRPSQGGVTLIELVIAIVVIGIAGAALYGAVGSIIGRSADPMLRAQSIAIAEALLDEALLRPLPDVLGACNNSTAAPRANYDDICDYDGLDMSPVVDAFGAGLPGLSSYRARMSVTPTAYGAALQVPAADGVRLTVTVTDPTGVEVVLDGYRARD